MVVEYMLLLVMSGMILAGAFGLSNGPVGMFKIKSPHLAKKVEWHIETGAGFCLGDNQCEWQQ